MDLGPDVIINGRKVKQRAVQQQALQQYSSRPASSRPALSHRTGHRLVFYGVCLVGALIALGAHQHYKLLGQSTPALVSLLTAGGLALVPLRPLVGSVFRVGGATLHMFHGLGALLFAGLAFGGVFSGAPLVSHAALAPFAMMGAAQALMHSTHPRNAAQADAMRRFATSLPEVEQFTKGQDLTSPANVERAVLVLTDLVSKAQALGETELQADPAFQSALSRVTTRFGLTLGLDSINQAINRLAADPAAASSIPGLRARLAAARKTVAQGA